MLWTFFYQAIDRIEFINLQFIKITFINIYIFLPEIIYNIKKR